MSELFPSLRSLASWLIEIAAFFISKNDKIILVDDFASILFEHA
jgi:hypothetical protein